MFDNLHAYFHENVLQTYYDYVKVKRSLKYGLSNDLKTAINLSTILYHLREHIPKDKRKSRKALSEICPDYDILGDVVNSSKHKIITKNYPKIKSAENIYEQIVKTRYKDKKGEYWHTEKSVFVKLIDKTERDLFEIITNVLNLWLLELEKLGVIEKIEPFKTKRKQLPRRSKNSDRLDIKMIRGVRFQQRYKLQEYNYDKGIIEPIDLTGSEFKMRLYKPSYTISLLAKNDKTGDEINLDIKVDEKQKTQFNRMKSLKIKIEYFLNLAKKQGVISEFHKKNQ